MSLQGAIIIHEVYEEGAASKDGRLWAGDQILDVRRNSIALFRYIISKVVAEFTGLGMNSTLHAKVAVAHWESEVARSSDVILKLNCLMLLFILHIFKSDTLNLLI